jgi:transcriptional/translational regulatory protein YebC/TACO1
MEFKRMKIFAKHAADITGTVERFSAGIPDGCTVQEALRDGQVIAAIDRAKAVNMPKDKIEKAIERGMGIGKELVEKCVFEIRGFGGVGVILICETDNRTRTSAQIKSLVNKLKSSVAPAGQVSFAFDQKAIIRIDAGDSVDIEEHLTELAISAGADDIRKKEGVWEIIGEKNEFGNISTFLKGKLKEENPLKLCIQESSSGIEYIPKSGMEINCDQEMLEKNLEFLQELGAYQDTISIVHNISNEI